MFINTNAAFYGCLILSKLYSDSDNKYMSLAWLFFAVVHLVTQIIDNK